MLTDEAPPPKVAANVAQGNAPPPPTAQDEALRAMEAQIRDLVISLLEKQTMEALGTPGIRDSLKAQLSDTISALARSPTKLPVFLPQFVIQ